MVIGAGEMSELALKHLVAQGSTDILVANRTFDKAVELASAFNGSAIRFEELAEHLVMADIVISSTGAPHFIITPDVVRRVIQQRRQRPMFLIDIAVPRDIDPKVNQLDNIYLYDVDDLQGVVQANLKERQKEAHRAEGIIREEIGQFHLWLANLEVKPTIVALRRRFEEIGAQEMAKTFGNHKDLTEAQRKGIEAMTNAIVNKLLHRPVAMLKRTQNETSGEDYVDAVRTLFDLPAPAIDETPLEPLDDDNNEKP
jgi:glutamyl-tRNA reductase